MSEGVREEMEWPERVVREAVERRAVRRRDFMFVKDVVGSRARRTVCLWCLKRKV